MKQHKTSWRGRTWKKPVLIHRVPTRWGWIVWYPAHLKIGYGVDIGYGTYIQAERGVTIGANAQVGSHCSIYSVDTIQRKSGAVSIGRNCLIGSHSTICPGVNIGAVAKIGAYSLVTESIPAGEFWCGIPARRKYPNIRDQFIKSGFRPMFPPLSDKTIGTNIHDGR